MTVASKLGIATRSSRTVRQVGAGPRRAVLATLLACAPALAALADDSAICDEVAYAASRRTGVPLEVLRAISLTETGRKGDSGFRPWPWTVNMEGAGHWFGTADEARAYVFGEFKRGARSFDVGCFQINYKWHGEAFTSIDQMFDPEANALYAGELLRGLFAETGSWGKAAGAYHSRTPDLAARYQDRFERILASLSGGAVPEIAVASGAPSPDDIPEIPDIVLAAADAETGRAPRVNSYPLLMAGGTRGNGSLVPIGAAPAGSLFPPQPAAAGPQDRGVD